MSDTSGAASSSSPSEEQRSFLQLLQAYRKREVAIPTTTADTGLDWTTGDAHDILGAIYTEIDVAPSDRGGRFVVLGAQVEMDGQTLQLMSDDRRNALLHALSTDDDDERANILEELAKSPQLRLRYPEHIAQAETFVADRIGDLTALDDQDELAARLSTLMDAASDNDKFRLFDLPNNYKSNVKGDSTRRARCMEFALRSDPASIPELVCLFEFYNAACEGPALAAAGVEIRQIIATEGRISDNRAKKIRTKHRKAKADLDARDDGMLDDGVFEEVTALLAEYKDAFGQLGFGTGATDCAYVETNHAANRDAIKALYDRLQFGDLSSAAYHAMKHFKELPPMAREVDDTRSDVQNEVYSYHMAARNEVRITAESKVTVGQFGGEKHSFQTGNMRAIAWLNPGGTGLATYTS